MARVASATRAIVLGWKEATMWRPTAAAALCSALVLVVGCGRAAKPARPAPQGAPAGESASQNKTGAVDSLPANALSGRHSEDIAEMLQGRVAGLQVIRSPNGDISLRIRGGDPELDSTGVVQAGEPLLVLDGMPVSDGQLSNTLRAIDPHEVANIQVLKDVASTSVYGIRGAHGVILITLKHE